MNHYHVCALGCTGGRGNMISVCSGSMCKCRSRRADTISDEKRKCNTHARTPTPRACLKRALRRLSFHGASCASIPPLPPTITHRVLHPRQTTHTPTRRHHMSEAGVLAFFPPPWFGSVQQKKRHRGAPLHLGTIRCPSVYTRGLERWRRQLEVRRHLGVASNPENTHTHAHAQPSVIQPIEEAITPVRWLFR